MDTNKVIEYLKTSDNIGKQFFIVCIKDEINIGSLITDLLCEAEKGNFFEMKKPEMVCLCLTKYSNYSNNYDNCSIEQIIGCHNCEWYVPKIILELFEKFEKEGFPTDEEANMFFK